MSQASKSRGRMGTLRTAMASPAVPVGPVSSSLYQGDGLSARMDAGFGAAEDQQIGNNVSNKTVAKLIDPDQAGSFTHRFRQHRNEEFKRRFPDLADMRVLDLGGTAVSWRVLGLRPSSVTIVNLDPVEGPYEPWMEIVEADACQGGFGKYDLVFSNSLMEHLGGHARRQQFAEVIQESAPSWWVQTPYRYFPVEPHWIFPLFQFLPFRMRVLICQHWNTLHESARKNQAEAAAIVASIELVSATEMRAYFPSSEIWYERIAGLPKSLVAIRSEK